MEKVDEVIDLDVEKTPQFRVRGKGRLEEV